MPEFIVSTSAFIPLSQKGADSGVASLDDTGNVPSEQLGNASGGGGLAIGDAVSGATHSALLGVDSSGNAISGPATASVVTGTPSGAGRVAVSIGSGSEVDFVSPGTLACRYDFRDFGGAPGRYVVDAVMASTSHTLTSSTAAFASADIGAYVAVVTQPGGGTAVTVGAGTITAVASGTSATVSFANGTGGSVSGCFCAIGPDNTTAVADAVTAMTTGIEGGLCYVPDGLYLLAAVPESNGQQILLPGPAEPFAYGFVGQTPPPKTPWNQFDGDSLPHQTGAIFLNVGAFRSGAPASGTYIIQASAPGDGGPMLVLHRLTFRNLPSGGGITGGLALFNAMACDLDNVGVDIQAAIAATPTPSPNFPVGLGMPTLNNAAWCRGGSIYISGYGYGLSFSEHTDIKSLVLAANYSGLFPTSMFHAAHFGRIGAWGHAYLIDNASGRTAYVQIDEIDIEDNWGPGWSDMLGHVRDPSDGLYGKMNIHHGTAGVGPDTTLTITGASNLDIFLMTAARGTQTPPAVPAASTDLQNPFWRDCTVVVSGGSSVAITVAGQALGIGSGPVLVPSGATINLGAYTGSPAWTWTIL